MLGLVIRILISCLTERIFEMKTITFRISILALLVIILLGALCLTSCRNEKPNSSFVYIDATVDDLSGKKFDAILIRNSEDPDKSNMMVVIGDIDETEKILGHEIRAEKVVDSSWIGCMVSGFVKAERVKRGYLDDAKAIFLTKDKGYVVKIAVDDKVVYGPNYQSEQLRKYFEEIGLLSEYRKHPDMNDVIEALKGEASKYRSK